MAQAAQTLEGWYCLHDFRKIDWVKWKSLSNEERQKILAEFLQVLDDWSIIEKEKNGSHGLYQILGQKADIMLMILRPTVEELHDIEAAFNKTKLAEFTQPAASYVSVVELSNYLLKDENPYENPEIRGRLYPLLPNTNHICFYPMNKRREGEDNWYMLPIEERNHLMRNHSMIGRKYAGKVKQIILGSFGFDNYEWGVALFSDDMLQFKKLIHEMRFDEVSARYGEFGSFFVGSTLPEEKLIHLLSV